MILPLQRNRKLRIIIALSLGIILFILLIIGTSYATVTYNASGRTYDNIDSIPHNRYGLLLATSPTTPRGTHNYYFDFRIIAADELYKAGKIEYIIASGGDYRNKEKYGCDEPRSILDSLVARGVPSERIILDYDGTRTINSISKAKNVYGTDSITLISQKFHNERAIYQADHFGIHTVGYNALSHHRGRTLIKNLLRESLARPKMFLDLIFVKDTIK